MLACVVTVLVLAAPGLASNDVVNHKWQRNPAFDGKLPASVSTSASFPASRRACAVQCSRQKSCLSFFFNREIHKCVLQTAMYSPQLSDRQAAGYRYYRHYETGTACPKAKNYVIDYTSMTCFRFMVNPQQWLDARATCQLYNETLAVLQPLSKARFVETLVRNNVNLFGNIFFIGASRPRNDWGRSAINSQLVFYWETGQQVDRAAASQFWNPADPDGNGHQNVLGIWSNAKWIDIFHTKQYYFICEKALRRQ